ncbi:MAG: aminoglycoside phosphotransferase family protein [Clostridiales bacterium]|nr:aminoglycoside phosphotransferase family protein [Clostridiales bacterium]
MSINDRYTEFVNISFELACKIVKEYDDNILVKSLSAIRSGRANSNHIIDTSNGKLVLRVCRDSSTYNNEIIIDRSLDKSIRRPELLYHTVYDGTSYLLYQYIESNLLGAYNEISNDIIEQVATLCARIHNTPTEKLDEIKKLDLPPFKVWYDHFLDNQNTINRIGIDVQNRIKKIIKVSHNKIECIDSIHTTIHNDFSLDNLILDNNDRVFITDWEGITVNHMLTDMGQFFRLSKKFSEKQLKIFEHIYNKEANIALPENWYELARLRDLVNLLQLISSEQDLPNYHEILKTLIIETLDYFESL